MVIKKKTRLCLIQPKLNQDFLLFYVGWCVGRCRLGMFAEFHVSLHVVSVFLYDCKKEI